MAYLAIMSSGMLSDKRKEAYRLLWHHGPATAMECLQADGRMGVVDSQIRARFNELRERGVIKEIGVRACRVTGMQVIEWDVTGKLPQPPEHKPRRSRDMTKEIARLRLALHVIAEAAPENAALLPSGSQFWIGYIDGIVDIARAALGDRQ